MFFTDKFRGVARLSLGGIQGRSFSVEAVGFGAQHINRAWPMSLFVTAARVLRRVSLPVVRPGEDLPPLPLGGRRDPPLLERWHYLCSLPGVLTPQAGPGNRLAGIIQKDGSGISPSSRGDGGCWELKSRLLVRPACSAKCYPRFALLKILSLCDDEYLIQYFKSGCEGCRGTEHAGINV